MSINIADVPSPPRHLVPMAQEWGVADDYEREEKISRATVEELERLMHCIDDVSDDDLFGWLEGDESYSATPSDAYAAFTCLTMAIDSAKLELRKRG